MQAQQEMVKVNIYGDSIMRATVMDENRHYHATMPTLLKELTAQYGLVFSLRTYFGSTIGRGAKLLQKDVEKGLDCRFALVEYGGNDCSYVWDEVAANPLASHEPLTLIGQFRTTLAHMVHTLQGAGVTPVLMTLPPVDAERHLHFIGKDETARQNILQWLGDTQTIYRFHEYYSDAIAKVALETGAILVDVRHQFLHRHDMKDLIGIDGVHLTPKGYQIVLETFSDFIAAHRRQPGLALF